MTDPLYWEATFAIALALKEAHPDVDLENVSLGMVCEWTLQLDQFKDDPELANDGILAAIYQDWYEESIHGQ